MPIDPNTIRRLAFIRYLHHLGIEQARQPEPLSSAGVLMLHDAVESFLILATDHLGAKASSNFEKYWETLSPHLPEGVDLAVQQGMKRLNKARVSLKHYDARPDVATINLAVTDTATFMAANTTLVFRLDYETVSMAYVIPQEPVRDLVGKAESASSSGDQKAGMIALVDALEELFDPHTFKAVGAPSPFLFGPRIQRVLTTSQAKAVLHPAEGVRPSWETRDYETLASQITEVTKVAQQVQAATRIIALGVDFADYRRFRNLTPTADGFLGGRREYRAPKGYAPTREDFAFCHQFIVGTALRLASVEAQLAQPPWVPTDKPIWRMEWETIAEVAGRDE